MDIIIRKDENYREIIELVRKDPLLREGMRKLLTRFFYATRKTLDGVLNDLDTFKQLLDELATIPKTRSPHLFFDLII